ncbi:MAG: glycosyltransferase [Bacteroidales bacterium]|nr:glycosyltransferase [Bacteroidales bacterium]
MTNAENRLIAPPVTTIPRTGIAFLHEDFPCGGAERVTIDIANFLANHNCRVYVLTANFQENRLPPQLPRRYEVITLPERHLTRSKTDADFIVQTIKERGITHFVSSRYLNHAAYIKAQTGCKYIFTWHNIPMWEPLFIERNKKKKSASLLGWFKWAFYYRPLIKGSHFWERKYVRRYREILDMADACTVLCEEYKEETLRKISSADPAHSRKIHVIPNAELSGKPLCLEKEHAILYIGRLTYEDKRADRLIDIWEKVCADMLDWHLYIVGDGNARPLMEAKAQHLPRVHFEGQQSDVKPYLDRASILCLVSEMESWGLCLTEAQANGVIPIAFDCSAGVRHILSPSGENGFLVPNGDLDAYCETLVKLANAAPEEISRLRRNVMEKSKMYSIENVGRLWLNMISEI